MFRKAAIIGDGAMATVCAQILADKGLVAKMWGHDPQQLEQFKKAGENEKFLPGYKLPETLIFEPEDEKIFQDVDFVISAVPCQYVRPVWKRIAKNYRNHLPVMSITKGIENQTLLRPTQIISEILDSDNTLAALSGPTIADELAQRMPATATLACKDQDAAEKLQHTMSIEYLRLYTNPDIEGVELAGAMKNVIAIAAGVLDGLKAGDNAKAALLARGLTEITRLGTKMGADEHTFAGLSGLGDLVTTCISPSGRNRSFGEAIAKGKSPKQALDSTNSVVEGWSTCKSIVALAEKHKVEMPITFAVHAVLYQNLSIKEALHRLMTRQLKPEIPNKQ